MKPENLTPETLMSLIEYRPTTGELIWRRRHSSLFAHCRFPERAAATWNAKNAGNFALNVENNGYRQGWVCGKVLKSHRVAWAIHFGEWPPDQVDHIDGNRANNRINNLREASNRQNCTNRPAPSGRTHAMKGVSKRPSGAWMARIKTGGKSTYLGQFDTEIEAAKSYDAAARRIHGEFALTNFE